MSDYYEYNKKYHQPLYYKKSKAAEMPKNDDYSTSEMSLAVKKYYERHNRNETNKHKRKYETDLEYENDHGYLTDEYYYSPNKYYSENSKYNYYSEDSRSPRHKGRSKHYETETTYDDDDSSSSADYSYKDIPRNKKNRYQERNRTHGAVNKKGYYQSEVDVYVAHKPRDHRPFRRVTSGGSSEETLRGNSAASKDQSVQQVFTTSTTQDSKPFRMNKMMSVLDYDMEGTPIRRKIGDIDGNSSRVVYLPVIIQGGVNSGQEQVSSKLKSEEPNEELKNEVDVFLASNLVQGTNFQKLQNIPHKDEKLSIETQKQLPEEKIKQNERETEHPVKKSYINISSHNNTSQSTPNPPVLPDSEPSINILWKRGMGTDPIVNQLSFTHRPTKDMIMRKQSNSHYSPHSTFKRSTDNGPKGLSLNHKAKPSNGSLAIVPLRSNDTKNNRNTTSMRENSAIYDRHFQEEQTRFKERPAQPDASKTYLGHKSTTENGENSVKGTGKMFSAKHSDQKRISGESTKKLVGSTIKMHSTDQHQRSSKFSDIKKGIKSSQNVSQDDRGVLYSGTDRHNINKDFFDTVLEKRSTKGPQKHRQTSNTVEKRMNSVDDMYSSVKIHQTSVSKDKHYMDADNVGSEDKEEEITNEIKNTNELNKSVIIVSSNLDSDSTKRDFKKTGTSPKKNESILKRTKTGLQRMFSKSDKHQKLNETGVEKNFTGESENNDETNQYVKKKHLSTTPTKSEDFSQSALQNENPKGSEIPSTEHTKSKSITDKKKKKDSKVIPSHSLSTVPVKSLNIGYSSQNLLKSENRASGDPDIDDDHQPFKLYGLNCTPLIYGIFTMAQFLLGFTLHDELMGIAFYFYGN